MVAGPIVLHRCRQFLIAQMNWFWLTKITWLKVLVEIRVYPLDKKCLRTSIAGNQWLSVIGEEKQHRALQTFAVTVLREYGSQWCVRCLWKDTKAHIQAS